MRSVSISILTIALLALLSSATLADVAITLDVRDAAGQPITGPVEAGTVAKIELFLAATGTDNPLQDVRGLQFNFSATDPGLTVQNYVWTFDPGFGQISYFSMTSLPVAATAYTSTAGQPGVILVFTDTPQTIATFEVVVNETGTLDLVSGGVDQGLATEIIAAFSNRQSFTLALGNLTGGVLELAVVGATGGGSSGGGGGGDDPAEDPDEPDADPDNPSDPDNPVDDPGDDPAVDPPSNDNTDDPAVDPPSNDNTDDPAVDPPVNDNTDDPPASNDNGNANNNNNANDNDAIGGGSDGDGDPPNDNGNVDGGNGGSDEPATDPDEGRETTSTSRCGMGMLMPGLLTASALLLARGRRTPRRPR